MKHYSVELWNNYNKVYHQFNSHIQGLADFIGMFNERYKSKINLAETLKNLSESKKSITTFESLTEGILGFKGDMYNEYNYLSELIVGMRDEIIKPLTAAYKMFSKKIDNNFSETSTINKEYINSLNQMEIYKNKFHSSVYAAEQSKLKAEYYKKKINSLNNATDKEKNKELLNEYNINLKQEETKANNYLKDAKNNEKIYISLINNTNILQEEYIEIKKRNLEEIQELEESLGEYIKDSLRKFIIFQVAYLRNMQYDVDKKAKILEGINLRNDIQKFINDNKKDIIPLKKFEYVPYISKLNLKEGEKNSMNLKKIPEDIIKEVNNFISTVFPSNRFEEIKFLKSKENVDIEQLVDKIYSGEKLNFIDTQEITKLIIKKRLRRLFLKEINNHNIKNENIALNDNTYDTINEIFNESLNVVLNDKDFESAKLIIDLSNILFRHTSDESGNKIFIISNLKSGKIIKSYEFWKELVKYDIIEEMHKQKKSEYGNNNEKKIKVKNINDIVLDKLNKYINDMINFGCKPNYLRQIIEEFNEYYHLNEIKVKNINKIIDDYENKDSNKDTNKVEIKTVSSENTSSNSK
jgi:hypothetical protein